MGASRPQNTYTRILSWTRSVLAEISICPNLSDVTITMAALSKQSPSARLPYTPSDRRSCSSFGFCSTPGSRSFLWCWLHYYRWSNMGPLPKPSFNRADMTDLPLLDRILRFVFDRSLKDGSMVDLYPLFMNLVGSQDSRFRRSGIYCSAFIENVIVLRTYQLSV